MPVDSALPACPVTSGDINIYHARVIADQQITFVLHFSSLLDLDRLNRAFALLVRTFPILSSVIRVKAFRFRREQVPDYCPEAKLAEGNEPVSEVIERFTGTACDPEREPSLKLLLIRRSGRDTLCFKIDHVATDASGLKFLLYALASAYAKGNIDPVFNPNRGDGQIFRRFSLFALLNAARRAKLPRPGQGLITGPFDAQPTFIEQLRLEHGEQERLRAAAKQAGATLNDVLLAALYRAVWQLRQADQAGAFPVMVPVDMRRYLPKHRQAVVANLSSAVYPSLAPVSGESLPDTLARVTAIMQGFKRKSFGLPALILMKLGAMRGGRMMQSRYQLAASRQSRFICLSNFGVIDKALCNFGAPLSQAYGVGPVQYAPGLLLAVSAFDSTLHLTVQGNDAERFQPFVHNFLNSIVSELARWQ